MSIPTNSATPPPPTGSSNPVSMKDWFANISTWIRGLSPGGATVYDTGWVACTSPNPGFNATGLRVRRIGRLPIMTSGGISPTANIAMTSGFVEVAQLPADFAPLSNEYPMVASVSVANAAGQNPNWIIQVSAAGVISLRNLSATAVTIGTNTRITVPSGSWARD